MLCIRFTQAMMNSEIKIVRTGKISLVCWVSPPHCALKEAQAKKNNNSGPKWAGAPSFVYYILLQL